MAATAAVDGSAVDDTAVDDTAVEGSVLDGSAEWVPGALPVGVATERLEAEMRSLSGHLAAATCSFLVMVGEYDERRGWESWEALSCAHWLSWHCGVGLAAAREQVRVARRLRELPAIRAEFARGRLSYSKVRALTRVAHTSIEVGLVEFAQAVTGAQLERHCQKLRRVHEMELAEDELLAEEAASETRRSLTWREDADTGELVVRLRIPRGHAADVFRATVDARVLDEPDDGVLEPLECRRLDALLDGLAAGADADSSLDCQPELVVHVTPPSTGTTDDDGAGGGAGLDPRWPCRSNLGSAWSLADTRRAACDAGLRRVLDLHDAAGTFADVDRDRPGPLDLLSVLSGPAISFDLGRHQRLPSRALRRQVMRRDGGTCRFPGCARRHRLQVHHIVFWEHGGRTDADNLVVLCAKHHRAIHHGGWTLTGPAHHLRFTNTHGVAVSEHAPETHGTLAELVDRHHRHGLDITEEGAGGRWMGDRIDWDCFHAAFTPSAPPPGWTDPPHPRAGTDQDPRHHPTPTPDDAAASTRHEPQ